MTMTEIGIVLVIAGCSFLMGWYLGRVHLMLDDMIKRYDRRK